MPNKCHKCQGQPYVNYDGDVQCWQCGTYLAFHKLSPVELITNGKDYIKSSWNFS